MKFFPKGTPKKSQPKKLICVYILSSDHHIMSEVAQFAVAMTQLTFEPTCKYAFNFHWINGIRPVQLARNEAALHFMTKTQGEKLWFIDADMIPPDSSLQLLESPAPINTGIAYRVNEHRLSSCQFVAAEKTPDCEKFGSIVVYPDAKPSLMSLDASGTGYLVINREVFADERMTMYEDGKPYWFREKLSPRGICKISEDIDFTWRAKQLGYDILAHTDVKVGHIKEINLGQSNTLFETMDKEKDRIKSGVSGDSAFV